MPNSGELTVANTAGMWIVNDTNATFTTTGGGRVRDDFELDEVEVAVERLNREMRFVNPFAQQVENLVAKTKKKKVESEDDILKRRVMTAINTGARIPVDMANRYCELIKRERHLNKQERDYFNLVKEDKVKMCDLVVEDIA